MSSGPVIEAVDLVKVFRGKREVRALDGVSFAVEPGTVLGLLGPNGAGKTTVVRVLSTVLRPDSGTARILGHDAIKEASFVRKIIGLAGQYATVDEYLTGRENLRMVGRLSHLAKKVTLQRADDLLDQFGLTDAANRPLKTYSGGMRRRLDLAAALVAHAPVLFLDEPTTGLDIQSRKDLWDVIDRLTAEGTTVLLTTQYLEEADRLADRIVVVDHGRVVAEGSPSELKAGLGTTVVALTFLDHAASAQAASLLASIVPTPPVHEGDTLEFAAEHGPKLAADALRLLDQHEIVVAGLAMREPSLDDVFLKLTGHRTSADEDAAGADVAEPAGVGAGR